MDIEIDHIVSKNILVVITKKLILNDAHKILAKTWTVVPPLHLSHLDKFIAAIMTQYARHKNEV